VFIFFLRLSEDERETFPSPSHSDPGQFVGDSRIVPRVCTPNLLHAGPVHLRPHSAWVVPASFLFSLLTLLTIASFFLAARSPATPVFSQTLLCFLNREVPSKRGVDAAPPPISKFNFSFPRFHFFPQTAYGFPEASSFSTP